MAILQAMPWTAFTKAAEQYRGFPPPLPTATSMIVLSGKDGYKQPNTRERRRSSSKQASRMQSLSGQTEPGLLTGPGAL
jgi:hypothetical protein